MQIDTNPSALTVIRSRPDWILGLAPNPGSAEISGSRGSKNGVARWSRLDSEIYSQNDHFGLVYDMIYQFLGMDQRIISLACFANNVIHPWPQMMLIVDREMPSGFTPSICLLHNFVYISTLENRGNKSIKQNFQNILLWIVLATFGKVIIGLGYMALKSKKQS